MNHCMFAHCYKKEIATHSSILAWKISWTGEPGELLSMGITELDTTGDTAHTLF